MREQTRTAIRRALEKERGLAEDNAVRARLAFGRMPQDKLDSKWGESGKTCRELWDGYEDDLRNATAVLEDFDQG